MQSISAAIIITQSRTANEHCPWHFLSKGCSTAQIGIEGEHGQGNTTVLVDRLQ